MKPTHIQVLLKNKKTNKFFFFRLGSLFRFIVCADIHTTTYSGFIDNFAAFQNAGFAVHFFF